jgi:broad specificity phosphatase PhoE
MTTRFILIRHGQTEWNRGAERFRGRADIPLNDLGHTQAQRIAARLAHEPIMAIYASPKQRTLDTARPLAERLRLPVVPHDGLLDIDFGALEGMTTDEARQVYPEIIEKWLNTPGQVTFPKGESLHDVRARIAALLDELASKHAGQTIALVSHRVVCCAMLGVVLGLPADALWRVREDNGCISAFEKHTNGFVVTLVNDTNHLTKDE